MVMGIVPRQLAGKNDRRCDSDNIMQFPFEGGGGYLGGVRKKEGTIVGMETHMRYPPPPYRSDRNYPSDAYSLGGGVDEDPASLRFHEHGQDSVRSLAFSCSRSHCRKIVRLNDIHILSVEQCFFLLKFR